MPARALRDAKLDLRLTSAAKRMLETAASASQRSLTDFVLGSALERADETLANRREFVLGKLPFSKFQAALDAPPRPLPRMRRLLEEPGFFDPAPATSTHKAKR